MTVNRAATLYFLCGKMAAGKSTIARELARTQEAVLLIQDEFFTHLFPGEITDIPSFVKYSSRLNEALAPHICALLAHGVSVVLDFPANTKTQRSWFRALLESAKVPHELHYVDATDDLCKVQLERRSAQLPKGAAFTSDAEFDALTKYFQPPSADEGFMVIRHVRV
jgi:predicted kinase